MGGTSITYPQDLTRSWDFDLMIGKMSSGGRHWYGRYCMKVVSTYSTAELKKKKAPPMFSGSGVIRLVLRGFLHGCAALALLLVDSFSLVGTIESDRGAHSAVRRAHDTCTLR